MIDTDPLSKHDLEKIRNFIEETIGISDVWSSKGLIESSVKQILQKHHGATVSDILTMAKLDKEVFNSLVQQVTVKETYFFRERSHIDLAVKEFIPAYLRKEETIRILSAGCSTGAEPYSLAMAIEEYVPQFVERCTIHGIDIDEHALRYAEHGMYTQHAIRDLEPKLIQKYFSVNDFQGSKRYHLSSSIRNRVGFQQKNLIDTSSMGALPQYHIIFYRNVSIYFDFELRKKIFTHLAKLLAPGGCLFTGSTETLPHDLNILQLTSRKSLFFFTNPIGNQNYGIIPHLENHRCTEYSNQAHTGSAKRISFPGQIPSFSTGNQTSYVPDFVQNSINQEKYEPEHVENSSKALSRFAAEIERIEKSKQDLSIINTFSQKSSVQEKSVLEKAIILFEEQQYEQAAELVQKLQEQPETAFAANILEAAILVEQGNFHQAKKICNQLIEEQPLSPDPYFLLGLAAIQEDEITEALQKFKETRYLVPEYWLISYYMATLYEKAGVPEMALKTYQQVTRLLAKPQSSTAFLLPYRTVNPDHIIHLCNYAIKNLQKSLSEKGGKLGL